MKAILLEPGGRIADRHPRLYTEPTQSRQRPERRVVRAAQFAATVLLFLLAAGWSVVLAADETRWRPTWGPSSANGPPTRAAPANVGVARSREINGIDHMIDAGLARSREIAQVDIVLLLAAQGRVVSGVDVVLDTGARSREISNVDVIMGSPERAPVRGAHPAVIRRLRL